MLVISGERKQENVQEDKKMKRIERSYGSFERRFRLPVTIKENEITAKLSNGVLNVRRSTMIGATDSIDRLLSPPHAPPLRPARSI